VTTASLFRGRQGRIVIVLAATLALDAADKGAAPGRLGGGGVPRVFASRC
jgi:hypothetical protein